MDSKELKTLVNNFAEEGGFKKTYGGWIKTSREVISVIELQKSNFGNSYYLNLKFFIQGIFETTYSINKKLVKVDCGDVFLRPPKEYEELLNLDSKIATEERRRGIHGLFVDFILPMAREASTRKGIKLLSETGMIDLLPAVKKELDKLL